MPEDEKMIRQDIQNKYLRSGYNDFGAWVQENEDFLDQFNDRKLMQKVVTQLQKEDY